MGRTTTARLPDVSDLRDVGRFLVALGDPTRQQIVVLLSRARLNVGELAARFQLSRPAVSHHLKVLADAGLLVQEREGRERVYRLDAGRCRSFADRLRSFVTSCCRDSSCC
jgi:DNA-binding transcriptional ArsR family regulator